MAEKQKKSRVAAAVEKKPKKQTSRKLSGKDYAKLRRSAYNSIVVKGNGQKETAEMLGVSEVTVSKWGNESDPTWKEQRRARQQCYTTDSDNTKSIIRLLSGNRLEIETEIIEAVNANDKKRELELRKQARGISDEISKHNKTLENLDKENRITLGVYMEVMESVFDSLRVYNEELFVKCVDFQSQHIRKKMIELG